MEIKKWEEIFRETVLEKYGRAVDRVVFKLPSGKEDEYYLKREIDAISALVITDNNHVVLTRQYRPGPEEIVVEIPGGGIDKNESLEEAIAREVVEETGYKGDVKIIGYVYADPYSNAKLYLAVVSHARKIAEPGHDENEFIETLVVPMDEFRKMVREGNMVNMALAYRALDCLDLL